MLQMKEQKTGISVSGLFRDMLVEHGLCDFETAVSLSNHFDSIIVQVDWLDTYNGTTFDKTFTPNKKN